MDTNCDPDDVDYVIPGNDDAIGAVKIISSIIANAVIEAREGIVVNVTDDEPVAMNDAVAQAPAEEKTETVAE